MVTVPRCPQCQAEVPSDYREDLCPKCLLSFALQSASEELLVGKPFSHYRVKQPIGRGGMGVVYLAEDTSLNRKVALKFLSQETWWNETARKRFLREAKSAAAIDHPYVCKVYEVGQAEGQDFIAMEYVEGQTLQQRLTLGRIGLSEGVPIASEIAEALEEAHRLGIIHRDLKPSNIMLTVGNHVKVMDFGIAKRPAREPHDSLQDSLTDLTRTQALLGTPA